MLQFFVRELQGLQTSDQVKKLVVNDCEMSNTKNWGTYFIWNNISRSWTKAHGPYQTTRRAALRATGCTYLF